MKKKLGTPDYVIGMRTHRQVLFLPKTLPVASSQQYETRWLEFVLIRQKYIGAIQMQYWKDIAFVD